MSDRQPAALEYADKLEKVFGMNEYAVEIRRLHEVNAELVEALKFIYAESCKAKEWINSVLAKAEWK